MGRNRIFTALFVITILCLQGCASVYIPSTHHTHQLNEQGEVSTSVLAGSNGIDVQAGYAVSDQLGIVGAASFGENDEENSEDYHKHSYAEVGIEYFRPFGSIGRFELIGGGGIGSATTVTNYNFFGPNTIQATGKYNKLFLQSNVGLETNWVETGLALRLGHVTYTEFETSASTYNESESGTFFEPAIFARLGWQNLKIEAQGGVSALLQDESEVAFDYRSFLMTVGLHFNLTTQ